MQFAIFDLDHTLLPIDSGDAWTHFIIGHTGSDRDSLSAKAVAINEAYRRGDFDAEDAVRFQMGLLARFAPDELTRLRDTFIRTVVEPQIRNEALALVNSRRRAGFTPILASGTHRFVTSAVARLFNIDILIAATPEVDQEGRFTGRVVGSHSYKDGKRVLLEAYLEPFFSRGPVDLEAYSDSINDLPMLLWVESRGGRPVAVNADASLAAEAIRHGWQSIELFAAGGH